MIGSQEITIDLSRDDLAAHLLVARTAAHLLILSDQGRAFRVPVETLPQTEVRGRGTSLPDRLVLTPGESLAAALALDEDWLTRQFRFDE